MGLLPVYARHEPSTDKVLRKYAPNAKKSDVVVYRDAGCKRMFCRFPWYFSNKPTRRRKTVMLNCFYWALNWVPDVAPAADCAVR